MKTDELPSKCFDFLFFYKSLSKNIPESDLHFSVTSFAQVRNELPTVYNRIRVEYVVFANIALWFLAGGLVLYFSPLFFALEPGARGETRECGAREKCRLSQSVPSGAA